MNDVQLTD